jgi:hypothetical protein
MDRAATVLLLLAIATPSLGKAPPETPYQVWKVGDRRWTAEEEVRFGKWVDENITEDFFFRYKIPTDCADVPYAARWIYSRIAHLPAAATTNDGKLIGHWTTDWRNLPTGPEWYEDSRFRAALLYMLSKTTTRTLPLDTYPVRIDRESVIPGTLFLISESHSGLVGHVSLDGSLAHPLETWESTLPVKVRKMKLRSFLSPRPESTTRSGLVKFRWVTLEGDRWGYCSVEGHPFYSEEQYASTFCNGYSSYVEAVAKRIDPTEYDPWEKMTKVIGTLTRSLRERAPIVLAGYERCRSGGCPEGSDLWEAFGTPSRDGMIVLLMNHLGQIIESNHFDEEIVRAMMEAIPIEISTARSVTFYHVYRNCLWLSSDPQDAIEMRWGLRKCEMILAQSRIMRSSIAFIERTYRRKDPKYADFAVGQQQEILRRLDEEWSRSQCTK